MHPLQEYLSELRDIRSTGGGVEEESYYGALEKFLNRVGQELRPRVRAIRQLADTGAGHPDFGLYTEDQYQRAGEKEPLEGQRPARGVVECKGLGDDSWVTAEGEQATRYWSSYGVILVTNFRDFLLVGESVGRRKAVLEVYRLAESERQFRQLLQHPRRAAEEQGDRFVGFLKRAMLHEAPLRRPQDVAWFLASYAREALARVEEAPLPALRVVRGALEEALGMKFQGSQGEHFFRSTLVQTLFYGLFSGWVLWHRDAEPAEDEAYDWMRTTSYIRVPAVSKLFHEIAYPEQLHAMDLIRLLDLATAVLNRTDREAFFGSFEEEQAVQYFYEPFLEAYDPELRKQLGVWYTPREVVEYMVRRVDTTLREQLDIPDGLADQRVYVLDPCCGTGAYLLAVLDRIATGLLARGGDALSADDVRQAAKHRVFGFEILPAPYVVAHLQLGLKLGDLGVPLKGDDRAGVYLTNALTGWEPPGEPQTKLPFVELEEERDAAAEVKQDKPILVILGNPPYSSYSGVAVEEERQLSDAYRETQAAPQPQGQGLNDLYVRFYRMAERRIVEQTGKGIVCLITNYSWLDGLSHTGMRERYLQAFDEVWIDCLNGDKYKTGKTTPWGEPDPSIFSTEHNREGIQVGTAIGLLVRKARDASSVQNREGATGVGPGSTVRFRHLWGSEKRRELLEEAEQGTDPGGYQSLEPSVEIGYPLMPVSFQADYLSWPRLTDLMPVSFPGVKTSRDAFLVDTDRQALVSRLEVYFDPSVSDEEIRRKYPTVMQPRARFQPEHIRHTLLKRGLLRQNIVRCCYRPFDIRWLYWEPKTKLLDEKRPDYYPHVKDGNTWLSAGQRSRPELGPEPLVTSLLAEHHVAKPNNNMFPLMLFSGSGQAEMFAAQADQETVLNLAPEALAYLDRFAEAADVASGEAIFYHALAIMHAVDYRQQNAGALRQDWARTPMPSRPETLETSADLGRKLAALLDPMQAVRGVSCGEIGPPLRSIGNVTHVNGRKIDPGTGDLELTAGWGYLANGATMPGSGRSDQRDYSAAERPPDTEALGDTTYDVFLNDQVYWRNVPRQVWEYTLGGYQVIKKWLSYRENRVLGRALTKEEVRYVTEMARRIAAILLLAPELNANYHAVTGDTYDWP
ncbi:MAG: type ISP restriction/modification enzyme [Candidatus Brocadiia bacterium]